ncbi:MAG: metallophosphoesterase [Lachnospiraceae bacterium]|nr:metallophosphoesterase [Lachnospiraceae bacterium]
MKYYISDMHLFHEAVLGFDQRPFENMELMLNSIKQSWNRKVTNGDTVYILGDVSMRGKSEKLISYVATLKGKKVLVKGNHDDVSDYRYQQLFAEICDYKEITDSVDGKTYDLVLCHYPIFSWKKMGRGTILLYGHTHNSPEDAYFQQCLAGMCQDDCRHIYKEPVRAINVGCMKPWMGYEPRTLKEILTL